MNEKSRIIRVTLNDGSALLLSDVQKVEYINACKYNGHQFLSENPKKESCGRGHKKAFSKKNHQ